jgi:hypothetical protein
MCLAYMKKPMCNRVNECRKQLFAKKARLIENIPPTKDALCQHMLRAVYQAGFVWRQSLELHQVLPNPSKWGWKIVNNSYQPIWMKLNEVSQALTELKKCKCMKNCSQRCTCKQYNLRCTELCQCGGQCEFI